MRLSVLSLFLLLVACNEVQVTDPNPIPDPQPQIYRLPIVVHVLHLGEEIGQGSNLSQARIERQIEILNEDYRRKKGTNGFNQHPDGGDARIEFVLAKTDPNGNPSTGIVRINVKEKPNPIPPEYQYDFYAHFSYWNPQDYINIWSVPLKGLENLFLGKSTGPNTDLPGGDLLVPGEPTQSEGIIVNYAHFGESDLTSIYNLGRTLTHEMGHYLGLLHTWGTGKCETNDFCEDTPPEGKPVSASCDGEIPLACNGIPAMIENYMTYSPDHCMHIFTNDQIERMHYVLEHSPFRKSLLSSAGLENPIKQ